jgi:hypothetical protein
VVAKLTIPDGFSQQRQKLGIILTIAGKKTALGHALIVENS